MKSPVVAGAALHAILTEAYPRAYAPRLDKLYFIPSEDFARRQLVGSTLRDYGFRPEVFDCDDFAAVLLGKIRERQCAEKWAYPAAIGMALGTLANGLNHVTNVAVTGQTIRPEDEEHLPRLVEWFGHEAQARRELTGE